MKIYINQVVPATDNNILADVFFKENHNGKVVLFCHGFKGFKDWGAWNVMGKSFAEKGYIFVKFNFSHNGIGQIGLLDFTRLDLFEKNNYSKEVKEVKQVLNWLGTTGVLKNEKVESISLMGHSRGGGIALVSAFEDARVTKVITLASIASFDRFGSTENIENWRKEGTKNFYNSRTKQDMKIGFQFYEDYCKNKKSLDIEKVCKNLNKPMLIIHGEKDPSVGFSHAQRLKTWKQNAELHLIEEANHVFGSKHPFIDEVLPKEMQEVVKKSLEFLKR